MISMNFFVRPMRSGEVDLLRVIEKRARERYLSFKPFERSAENPAIAPERFDGAEAFVAIRQDTLIGFILLQAIDRNLYIANISVVPEASARKGSHARGQVLQSCARKGSGLAIVHSRR